MAINLRTSGGGPSQVRGLEQTGSASGVGRTGGDAYEMRQTESTGARAATGARDRSSPLTAMKNFFTQTIPNLFKSLFGRGAAAPAAPPPPPVAAAPARLDLSAYSGDPKNGPRRLLNDVLANTNPALTSAFEAHCEKSLVADDLTFMRVVQAFREAPSLPAARFINNAYVAPRSEHEMNLSGDERNEVRTNLANAGNPPPANLFDRAFDTVFSTTAQNQGASFIASGGR